CPSGPWSGSTCSRSWRTVRATSPRPHGASGCTAVRCSASSPGAAEGRPAGAAAQGGAPRRRTAEKERWGGTAGKNRAERQSGERRRRETAEENRARSGGEKRGGDGFPGAAGVIRFGSRRAVSVEARSTQLD